MSRRLIYCPALYQALCLEVAAFAQVLEMLLSTRELTQLPTATPVLFQQYLLQVLVQRSIYYRLILGL